MSKTEAKSPAKKRELIPQKHGGALMTGGTNKGGTGRPPDEFRRILRDMVSRDDRLKHVETVLENPEHPQWMAAWKWATEHGYGKPVQPVEQSGNISLTIKVVDG